MSENAKAVIFIICLFLGLPIGILLLDDWLKRRRNARNYAKIGAATFNLPFHVSFVSSREDMLHAYEAQRIAASGLRRAMRWGLVGMGLMWLFGVVFFWTKASKLQLFIWSIFGIAIIWSNVIKPFFERKRILAHASEPIKVTLDFLEDGIHIELEKEGKFHRVWDELNGTINCDEGILVFFGDGVVNWLPQRVFQNEKAQSELYSYLNQKVLENESKRSFSAESQ